MTVTTPLRLPDFIFIGPDKAGSSWLYEALNWHPSVFVPEAKELFFFDRYWNKGIDWYGQFFQEAARQQVAGELSHDYLFSVAAADRIAAVVPHAKLIVCLREPVARAFSSYLYMLRQGRTELPFGQAIRAIPELLDHGRYDAHLAEYLTRFPRQDLFVGIFDDLVADPNQFAGDVFRFLGVEAFDLPAPLRAPVLPAARARSHAAAKLAKLAAQGIRFAGRPDLVGRVKHSARLTQMLYAPYRQRPLPDEQLVTALRGELLPHVLRTEQMTAIPLVARWRYDEGAAPAAHRDLTSRVVS